MTYETHCYFFHAMVVEQKTAHRLPPLIAARKSGHVIWSQFYAMFSTEPRAWVCRVHDALRVSGIVKLQLFPSSQWLGRASTPKACRGIECHEPKVNAYAVHESNVWAAFKYCCGGNCKAWWCTPWDCIVGIVLAASSSRFPKERLKEKVRFYPPTVTKTLPCQWHCVRLLLGSTSVSKLV